MSGLRSSRTPTFTGTGAFSGTTSNSHGALGIYSMTEGVTIAFNGPGTASFDYSADNTLVPDARCPWGAGPGRQRPAATQGPGRLSPTHAFLYGDDNTFAVSAGDFGAAYTHGGQDNIGQGILVFAF